MRRGWIKLWRKAFDSGMHKDHKLWVLWTWLLANVTHKEFFYVIGNQKIKLLPGQIVTSYAVLAAATGMSVKQARNRVLKLEKFGNVASKGTNKYSLLTVVNWQLYQDDNKKKASKRASNGQAEGKQRATKQEGKNKRKGARGELHPLPPDFELKDQHQKWAVKNRFDDIDLKTEIEKFREYYIGKGVLRANWDFVFYSWIRKCRQFCGPQPEPPATQPKDDLEFFTAKKRAKK
jgi:hypothetical protein